MEIILRKRFGNYWFRVNELIQPHTYLVDRLMDRLHYATVHEYWDWVIRHVEYPYGHPAWDDLHKESAFWRPTLFGRAPRFAYVQPDYWALPGEVLRDRVGDCTDSSALLTSMLRHFLSDKQVYMSVGWYENRGKRHLHAWTTLFLPDGRPLALDTTYERPLPAHRWILESPHYQPFWRANDRRTLVLQPIMAQDAYRGDLRIQASAPSKAIRYATG